ncbi:uncharacterized protein LOC115731081 isoform X2 [Rhodamnia argentea]|uniref:Uncharacterized protein LOC115731081 isoform X2 n=1 Tax=Rhodamnia argentea TaxID=178133 RepID=A0A8B8N6G7_9MYRT|nr:uncharacterized protein LOC115731081 isoform X2 [Rhodamnia argentea]
MSSKDSAFQVFGQRSIKSSALFRSSIPDKDAKEDVNGDRKAGWTRVSLSEFLDQKLRRTSASPGTVQGKAKPYSTLLGSRDVSKLGNPPDCKKKASVEKKNSVDKTVFEQFKLTYKENGEDHHVATVATKVGGLGEDERRESRKRRNPFEGGIFAPLKRVLVLGQAPSPEQGRNAESIGRNEKRRPLYNHYANGGGFWDSGMEGFESEEVGQSEVWEGVGSTIIGGVDWH